MMPPAPAEESMLHLSMMVPAVCNLAVVVTLWLALLWGLREALRAPRTAWRIGAMGLVSAGLGLIPRLIAPFGPHTASGRDLTYLDCAIEGLHSSHAHLLASCYGLVGGLSDPVAGVLWGQALVGAAGCGLVALLAWVLTRRQLAGWLAGVLAALVVANARVDAGPTALATLRLFLLLAVVFGHVWRTRRDPLALSVVAGAVIALGHARLEGPLLGALVLTWLAVDGFPRDRGEDGASDSLLWLGLALGLTSLASLMLRPLLLGAVPLVAWALVRRNGGRLAPPILLAVGALVALLLVPRVLEVFSLERDTVSRFPWAFLTLFGRQHLMAFDPWQISPVILVTVLLGLWRWRGWPLDLRRYLVCVGLPVYLLYMFFMGDTSARMKLQGTGVHMLLPLAGAAAAWLAQRMARWRGREVVWGAALALVLAGLSLPFVWGSLQVRTSLQQEFALLKRLPEVARPGESIYFPMAEQPKTLIGIPEVILRQADLRAVPIGPADALPSAPGGLVYLGAGCRRFHNGNPLPGVGMSLSDSFARDPPGDGFWFFLRYAWDKFGVLQERMDALPVVERPECARVRLGLVLVPVMEKTVGRGPFEGRWMPREPYPFGLYRIGGRP